MLKISFCTVCMNRLSHLQVTLLQNIADNADYDHLEFVILDYNSADGLEQFIKTNLAEQIASGRVVYYKTTSPQYFNRSHSRNLLFKLAGGDIICNIDADNFTGKGFAAYVNQAFAGKSNVFLSTMGATTAQDVLGRICLYKKDFITLRGFDERMINYGFEDYDLINRLQTLGREKLPIANKEFLKAISHDDNCRIANEATLQTLQLLLINYLTPASSELIFLFEDNTFARGTIIDTPIAPHFIPVNKLKKSPKYQFAILQDFWLTGKWTKDECGIKLLNNDTTVLLKSSADNNSFSTTEDNNNQFYIISKPELIEEAVFFYNQLYNRIIMEHNQAEKVTTLNHKSFGADTVYRNFYDANPIIV